MTHHQFAEHLAFLRLSISEAAMLLGVSERTVRRWADEGVPGPAAAAVSAWRELEARRLPWKPDSVSVLERDHDQLERIRAHDQLLAQVMREVEDRGGPANPWAVDFERNRASFGSAEVGFYRLQNGGFSVSTYRRFDRAPSDADKPEIADAVYCIAEAFARVAVAADALRAIAGYTRDKAQFFVVNGPDMLTPAAAAQRREAIVQRADQLDALAEDAPAGQLSYARFEDILRELHRLGFFPGTSLVSAVAHSMLTVPRPGLARQ
jgi:hypothetical protein